MKRFVFIFLILCIFAFSAYAVSDDAVFNLIWKIDGMERLVFGLTTEEPQGYEWIPSSDDNPVFMNNPSRVNENIEVRNITPLYAYCQAYSDNRFNINISGDSFSYGSEVPIPFTISWSGDSVESNGEEKPIFFYEPSEFVYSQSRQLTITSIMPDSAASAGYKGYIKLELEVLT